MSKGKALNYDWTSLEMEYVQGNLSLKEIAVKHNLSWSGLRSRANRFKWNRKSTNSIIEDARKEVVQKVVDVKLEAIKAHEAKAYRVSDKLISGVENNYDAMPDGLLDVSMLNGLAQALSTSVKVARLSLGAVDPSTKVDVTSGGLNMHETMLKMLEASRAMAASGKLVQADIDAIDVEGLLSQHAKDKEE